MRIRPVPLALALLLALGLPTVSTAQWARITEVPADEVGALLHAGGTLYAGALDAVYVSRDGGTMWTRSAPLPAGLDGVWALAEHEGRLFAGCYGGVLESTDGGATWVRRDEGLVGLGARTIMAFAVRAGSLYAGTGGGGVFRLDLTAANPVWAPYSDGLPGNVDAVFAMGTGLVAGGGANGYVFLRADGAPAWAERSFVPFDPNGPRMLAFTEAPGVLIGGGSHGLFRSMDGGETWTRFNPGVGLLADVSLAPDGARVYALSTSPRATYVAVSDDAGLTWPLLEQIPGAFTYSAAVAGGRLFAGRLDGLWVRPLTPTPAEDVPEAPVALRLLPGAPDPFTTSTRLAYWLEAPADVTLAVYDGLGRRVAVLAEGPRAAGRHEVAWAPGALPSGAYVARLAAGGAAATRVLTLVR